jgi:hypothetical protein
MWEVSFEQFDTFGKPTNINNWLKKNPEWQPFAIEFVGQYVQVWFRRRIEQ